VGQKGGPRETRRLLSWRKPVSWDVAFVRPRAWAAERRWRVEVGPTLPCVHPRPLRFAYELGFSFECLVFAEIRDGYSERVDRNEFVRHPGFEKEDKVRRVKISLQFAMVGGRVIDHVEVHSRAEGRRLHLFERDLLHVYIDLGSRCIGNEFLDDVILAVGVENAIRKLAVEEVQGLREIVLNRVAVAAVVEGAKLGQKIFCLPREFVC
jgi:hypothetical protein